MRCDECGKQGATETLEPGHYFCDDCAVDFWNRHLESERHKAERKERLRIAEMRLVGQKTNDDRVRETISAFRNK